LKFKFDLNSNLFLIYKTVLKKKRISSLKTGIWAESTARPSQPHRARGLCGLAFWRRGPADSRARTA
jgi:hypothetical protein